MLSVARKMAECVACFCKVLLFFVLNVYFLDLTVADTTPHLKPSAEFSRHTLVKPKIYHGREKRQISTSREKGRTHAHDLTVNYEVGGRARTLDLTLNRELLPRGHFRRYQKDGRDVVHTPGPEEVELCHYQGKIRGVPESWAAISTCRHGLSGIIFDGKELHHVEKATQDQGKGFDDYHFFYNHRDLVETNKTCGYHDPPEGHHGEGHHELNRILRYKRASAPVIRGPYNANKKSRYVELVLVVDNKEYKEYGENLTRVYQHCKDIANIINGLYSSLNIFIALVGVVVWTERDEIVLSPNGDTTLTNFLHYRREKLIIQHPNDNAQLLTKFVFDKGVVGKALKGPICTFEYSGGVSMDHSTVVSLVATTVAHEMGHNFGMEHDNNECHCPEERCIMAPSSSSLWPTHWSSCSLEYLALAFEKGMDYCLRNKPQALFDSPVCGNGFVEPGEQCDCGLPQTCNNTCCNATTCMLFSNASCATGECCDLTTCHPKTAGSLCRAADYECDLPEYCTGQSEYCPADIYKMDTEICDNGKAYCYQGSCRTRSDQCKLLWGNTGKSSDDQCYTMNTRGTRHGNCGYQRTNKLFVKCEAENVLCGMLHCRHLNERLEFGMESVAILSQSFINLKGSVIPCRTAIVDLGLNQVDPGLSPDGAKCGEGKMCVNQKCMMIDSLRAMNHKCPQDCNGNGVCNSLGHCHCRYGFAPPYCDNPGPGGSEDSGPASDPNARKEFVMALYIIFLGIIPLIAIVSFLLYYTKHNVNFRWQKANTTSKQQPKPRSSPFPPEPTARDDNSSLLPAQGNPFQTDFFGQCKGFTLSPLLKGEQEPKPQRSAPPVPVVPTLPIVRPTSSLPTFIKNNLTEVARSNTLNQKTTPVKPVVNPEKQITVPNAVLNIISTSIAPALPPLNPGSSARPLISSPILETSTCTAKELMSPLKSAPKVPLRPAPETPPTGNENRRPLSSPNTIINAVVIVPDEIKKPKDGGSTLNRIASFLKKEDKKPQVNTNSLPRNASIKANKILDKTALKTIEISNPILQSEIAAAINAVPVEDEKCKAVVMRAQSMRGSNNAPRAPIPTFGSMRQPSGAKRPTSIPTGNRPKSPPPPRPPLPEVKPNTNRIIKIPGLPGYQAPASVPSEPQPKPVVDQYDDCANEAPLADISEELSPISGDNIYAVIEENPRPLESDKSNSGSSESMGLLGEIVSEIQNRNFDSIYSTSTLARKKKEEYERQLKKNAKDSGSEVDSSENYVNTSAIYKSPESVYSNMGNLKSSASSTASGYIHPSAVNTPQIPTNSVSSETKTTEVPPRNVLSTFKNDIKAPSYKAFPSSTLNTKKSDTNTTSTASVVTPSTAVSRTATTPSSRSNSITSTTSSAPGSLISRQITPPNLRTRKPSPTRTAESGTPAPLNRQITPPNIRTRKPSPTRNVPSSPKTLPRPANSNSPDIVISCSTTTTSSTKSPDVVNNGAKSNAKPNGILPKPVNIAPKSVKSVKTQPDRKPLIKANSDVKPTAVTKVNKINSDLSGKVLPVGSRVAAKQASNVANLQQKFENKPPVAAKTIGKKK